MQLKNYYVFIIGIIHLSIYSLFASGSDLTKGQTPPSYILLASKIIHPKVVRMNDSTHFGDQRETGEVSVTKGQIYLFLIQKSGAQKKNDTNQTDSIILIESDPINIDEDGIKGFFSEFSNHVHNTKKTEPKFKIFKSIEVRIETPRKIDVQENGTGSSYQGSETSLEPNKTSKVHLKFELIKLPISSKTQKNLSISFDTFGKVQNKFINFLPDQKLIISNETLNHNANKDLQEFSRGFISELNKIKSPEENLFPVQLVPDLKYNDIDVFFNFYFKHKKTKTLLRNPFRVNKITNEDQTTINEKTLTINEFPISDDKNNDLDTNQFGTQEVNDQNDSGYCKGAQDIVLSDSSEVEATASNNRTEEGEDSRAGDENLSPLEIDNSIDLSNSSNSPKNELDLIQPEEESEESPRLPDQEGALGENPAGDDHKKKQDDGKKVPEGESSKSNADQTSRAYKNKWLAAKILLGSMVFILITILISYLCFVLKRNGSKINQDHT